jgi:nicotinamidase-related amidase
MKSAYLVLDMLNDLIHDDGASGKSPLNEHVRARGIIARTAEAIRKARARGITIVFVRVAFSDDYREVNPNSPVFVLKSNGTS